MRTADPARALIAGLLALEFATAAGVYVAAVILPAVVVDLHAADRYPLVVAPTSLGLFLALPLSASILHRLGVARTLLASLAAAVIGSMLAATAGSVWVFAAGRLLAGFAGGVLGVYGLGAALEVLDDRRRTRVLALLAATWLLPALVIPPLAALAESAVGWRWTSVLLLPLIIAARFLIRGRASPGPAQRDPETGSTARALLVPAGMTLMAVSAGRWWGWPGLALALGGAGALLPPGTLRARPGVPRALAVFAVLSTAYFAADSLLTLAAGRGLGLSTAGAAWVLGVTGVGWGISSQLQPRLVGPGHERDTLCLAMGFAVLIAGLAALTTILLVVPRHPFGLALIAAAACGFGMGVAYPTLYFRATTLSADGPSGASTARAVILTEALATSIGIAGAAAGVSTAVHLGGGERLGQAAVFGACAVLLLAGWLLAARTGRTDQEPAQKWFSSSGNADSTSTRSSPGSSSA